MSQEKQAKKNTCTPTMLGVNGTHLIVKLVCLHKNNEAPFTSVHLQTAQKMCNLPQWLPPSTGSRHGLLCDKRTNKCGKNAPRSAPKNSGASLGQLLQVGQPIQVNRLPLMRDERKCSKMPKINVSSRYAEM